MENSEIFSQDLFQKKFGFSTKLLLVRSVFFIEKLLKCLQKEFSSEEDTFFFFAFQIHSFSVALTYRRAKQSNMFSLSMCLNTGELLVKVLAVTRLQIMGKSLHFIWHPVKSQVSIQNVMDRMLKFSCVT